MRFARRVFTAAAVYGILVLAPMYFTEAKFGLDHPPAVTHPEFYYGFVGLALVWQFLFLAIARDPLRLRPVMPFAVLEKASFGIAAPALYFMGRLDGAMLLAGCIDLLLGALFAVAWLRTREAAGTVAEPVLRATR